MRLPVLRALHPSRLVVRRPIESKEWCHFLLCPNQAGGRQSDHIVAQTGTLGHRPNQGCSAETDARDIARRGERVGRLQRVSRTDQNAKPTGHRLYYEDQQIVLLCHCDTAACAPGRRRLRQDLRIDRPGLREHG